MFYYAAVMFKETNGKFSRTDSWITLTRREVVNLRVFPRGCLVQLTKEVEWIIYLIVLICETGEYICGSLSSTVLNRVP